MHVCTYVYVNIYLSVCICASLNEFRNNNMSNNVPIKKVT